MVIQEVSRKIAVTKEQLDKLKSKSIVIDKVVENTNMSNAEVVEQIVNDAPEVEVAEQVVNDSPVLEVVGTPVNEAPVLEVAESANEAPTSEVSIFDAPVSPEVSPVVEETVVVENAPKVVADTNQNVFDVQEEATNLFVAPVVDTNLEVSNTQEVAQEVSLESVAQENLEYNNDDVLAKLDLLTSALVDLQELLEQIKVSINELKEVKSVSNVKDVSLDNTNKVLDVNVGIQMEPTPEVVNNDFEFTNTNIFDQVPSSFKL